MIRREVFDTILNNATQATIHNFCPSGRRIVPGTNRDDVIHCKEGARQLKLEIEKRWNTFNRDEMNIGMLDTEIGSAYDNAIEWCRDTFQTEEDEYYCEAGVDSLWDDLSMGLTEEAEIT